MKRILLLSIVAIILCGCGKTDEKTNKETSKDNTKSCVNQVFYKNYEQTGDVFDSLNRACYIVEEGELVCIRMVYEGMKDDSCIEYEDMKNYLVKTRFEEEKLKDEKICDLENEVFSRYKFKAIENNQILIYNDMLINDEDKVDIITVSLKEKCIVSKNNFKYSEIETAVNLGENEGLAKIGMHCNSNVIKYFFDICPHLPGIESRTYTLIYDYQKNEIIEKNELDKKINYRYVADSYSLCTYGDNLAESKWCIVDNDCDEVKQIFPEGSVFKDNIEIYDKKDDEYYRRKVVMSDKDDICYLADESGFYIYDLKSNNIEKALDYEFKNAVELIMVSEKEFYCRCLPKDDGMDEDRKYQLLHITLE